MILFVEKVAARCCLGDENGLADFAGVVQRMLRILVAAPPRIADPLVVFSARIVFFELARLDVAG